MKKKKTAFSFVEMILIVAFLGIFAFIAVPRLNFAIISKQKADIFARKIVTDLRLTRRLAISHAANNTQGYDLRLIAPVPFTSYEIVDLSPPATTVSTLTIDSDVSVTAPTGIRFIFGPLGNLKAGSGTEINISAEGRSFTITFNSATGTVKCIEN